MLNQKNVTSNNISDIFQRTAEKRCKPFICLCSTHLHQSLNDSGEYFFYERWESRELWLDHVKSDHVIKFREVVDSILIESNVLQLNELGF
ncbi:MAG: antibiotic biosynthesis monooxygenase [Crocinitomicaceae bacterium]|nr:antibiotic biosynthesis monooxygenase [Crocinitomicaceae bacterium]